MGFDNTRIFIPLLDSGEMELLSEEGEREKLERRPALLRMPADLSEDELNTML
jgi:hypothetical protein